MKKLKKIGKKALIIYVIVYLLLSSMSSCSARMYDAQCGEYVSQYARDFIAKYCTPTEQKTQYELVGEVVWSGGDFGKGTFIACCNTGIKYMYKLALSAELGDYGWANDCSVDWSGLSGNPNWEDVTNQTLQPGDIVINDHHTEMYIGNNENANFGNDPYSGVIVTGPRLGSDFVKAYRPKFDVTPTGTLPVEELEDEDLNIYDENGFIYTGVAKIEGYKGSAPFGKWIFKMLTQILDYLIGILTLGVRVVFVGWTAIIERFVIDGIVNAVTGVTNKRDQNWVQDPDTIDEIDQEVQQEEATENQTSSQPQASGDINNPNEYISAGMQGIADIGGKVQLKTTSEANVTVENIVYNKIPILDINFFNFESAGGAVVDKDGIIYIIKENVAMWYYIFRIMAIVTMLAVLIYLGIKMAITTVAEKKAVYKQMMMGWLIGFILVFAINYVMYAIIYLNESLITWLIPNYEDGSEISLYESVRSKAYELKATTGFAGMIMYMILVYYAIRFLLVYFKRYLTVTILALISPFVAVVYAIKRINSNGGAAQIFTNWFKDFLYTVIIQSIHALIYTVFVETALKLTETSLTGIVIAFFFLRVMLEVDPIVRKIFGLEGKNGAKLAVEPLAAQIAVLKGAAKSKEFKQIKNVYGNYLGNSVVKPTAKFAGKISNKLDEAKVEFIDKYGSTEYYSPEKIKEREEKKKERDKKLKELKKGAKVGFAISTQEFETALKGAATVPLLIVEPALGVELLRSTLKSEEKLRKTIAKARKNKIIPKSFPSNTKFKLKGIQPRNRASANRLMSRLTAFGMPFITAPGRPIPKVAGTAGNGGRKPAETKVGQLTDEQRRILTTKLGMAQTLKYAKSDTTIEELIEEGNFDKAEAYADLLAEAKEQEEELELEFKELTGRMEEQIAEMEKINPEFARVMREKKTKELAKAALILSKPLSEKDIYDAVRSYKSKVPQFDENAERLNARDVQGIAKEINAVLKKKGTDMEMSKEFVKKVQQEIANNQRKMREEKERQEQHDVAGQDISAKGKGKTITPKQKTLKEQIKELEKDNPDNPYASQSGNAPKQNGTKANGAKAESGSSVERLVRNIRNASRGTTSKTTTAFTPKTMEFAKRLDALDKLSEQVAEITGEQLYDIDDVLRRLEAL